MTGIFEQQCPNDKEQHRLYMFIFLLDKLINLGFDGTSSFGRYFHFED